MWHNIVRMIVHWLIGQSTKNSANKTIHHLRESVPKSLHFSGSVTEGFNACLDFVNIGEKSNCLITVESNAFSLNPHAPPLFSPILYW